MSEYPSTLRRMAVTVDVRSGRQYTITVDVPAEWADWPDSRRLVWAGDRCADALHSIVDVTWADADDAAGPSWDTDGEPV